MRSGRPRFPAFRRAVSRLWAGIPGPFAASRVVYEKAGRHMNLSLAESMIGAASLEIAGKPEDALAELCRARDAGHHSAKLYNAIGHMQFGLRRFRMAACAYQEALRVEPGDGTTLYNRAVC